MPPVERSPAASSLPLPGGRRLLSRLTSPFASKTRHVQDYYITVDDPHKHYSPGDQVAGAVHLTLNKPIRVTHLVVCLHGFVQVYKNPGVPPADSYRANNNHVGTGRGSKSGEYFGNGFASLFEDEVILCGDGKLDDGEYQFQFVLEFPDRDLPSSISFERGTISYMITATLTRPTTISPTIQCDHKVYFVETIDISQLLPPKPRTITLEPISRKSRARQQARKLVDNDRKSRKAESTSNQQNYDRRGSQTSSSPSLQAVGGDHLTSPAPSEVSLDSQNGSQGPVSQRGSSLVSPQPSDTARYNGSKVSLTTKTITAEVESLTGGCLRGDNIPIRIHVDHTKHVRSLHGVIITLYRHARVDLHPAIPLGPTEKGKEAKYEDYYPKSVTGLGGLSLSGAGSSHTFRKDMSQTTLPLIVDPASLTAEVTGKLHVPEEAFPTISTVPGAMISFKYYVEVVIDVQGKLSTHDRNFGNLGGLASTMNQAQIGSINSERSMFGVYGPPVIDTAAVRRDKGVVACTFEIIIGTKDSERRKGKRKAEDHPQETEMLQQQQQQQQTPGSHATYDGTPSGADSAYYAYQWYGSDQGYYDSQYYNAGPYPQEGYHVHDSHYEQALHNQMAHQDVSHGHPPVPMPPVENESELSEKEQLRRAEARLLPSQPPGADDSMSGGAQGPTAPYLPDERVNGYVGHPPMLLSPPVKASSSRVGAFPTNPSEYASNFPLPATPRYEATEEGLRWSAHNASSTPAYRPPEQNTSSTESTPTPSANPVAMDDKSELERQRLQMESEPPEDEAESSLHASRHPLPSAPVLTEADELYIDSHDSHADASASAELPRYER